MILDSSKPLPLQPIAPAQPIPTRRLRCLWVTFGLPYPPHSGARLRYFHLLRQLAPVCDVYLLTLLEYPQEAKNQADLEPFCRQIETVVAPQWSRWQRLVGPPRHWPLPLRLYFAPELAARLQRLVSQSAFDIVEIDNLELAPYVWGLPPNMPAKKVLGLHNVGARQYRLPGDGVVSRLAGLRGWLKWRLLQGWDARLARHFDQCVTVSELDRQRLADQLGRSPARDMPIRVIANGVDVDELQPLPPPPADAAPTILFVGLLVYEPNMDAVRYFVREIFPRVLEAVPAARFIIAGRNPPPAVQQLARPPQITVQGSVSDLRPLYRQAHVVVVPLRAGGGTRLKILEALALGRPVVSTPTGCEGLELEAGQHLHVASAAPAFAQAVINLLRSPAECAALAHRGRARVVERYAWPQIADRLLHMYQQLAELEPSSAPTGELSAP